MSEFLVNTDKLKYNSSDIKQICKSINNIKTSVGNITACLAIEDKNSREIKIQLKNVYESILDEAVKLNSLSEAVLKIARSYENTEKQILKEYVLNKGVKSGNNEKRDDIWVKINERKNNVRAWLVEHGLFNPQKQERKAGEKVTVHQQREQDIYMQKEIEKIGKEKRFSKKNWNKASLEERKNILEEYIQKIAVVMGLDIASINFFYAESEDGYATRGYYSSDDGTININEWVINEGDTNGFSSYASFSTIVHEMRHAYQDAACKDHEKFVVTEETVEKWEKSFEEYKSSEEFEQEGMSEEEAYEQYRSQEVERDARSFAKQG